MYLQPLLQSDHFLKAVSIIIALCVNGHMPPKIDTLFKTSRLIALDKVGTLDVRPVAIPEVFMQLAQRSVMQETQKVAVSHLQPLQIGVGVRNATDIGRLFVSEELREKKSYILLVDCDNAFNSVKRADILKAMSNIEQDAANMVSLSRFLLHKPCPVVYQHREDSSKFEILSSQQGTLQGHVLSGFHFAAAIQPALLEIRAKIGAPLMAYLDDITMSLKTPVDVVSALQQTTDSLAKVGLKVNLSKTRILSPSLAATRLCTNFLKGKGLDSVQVCDSAKILGVPVFAGHDNSAQMRSWLEEEFTKRSCVVDVLNSPLMPFSSAAILARFCFLQESNFFLRAMIGFKNSTIEPIQDFERAVRKAVCAKLKTDPHHEEEDGHSPPSVPELSETLASLPLPEGGLSLVQHSDDFPAQPVAAFLEATPFLTAQGFQISDTAKNHHLQLCSDLKQVAADLDSSHPLNIPALSDGVNPKPIQAELCKELQRRRIKSVLGKLSKPMLHVNRAASLPSARTFLSYPGPSAHDDIAVEAARLRLGIPQTAHSFCDCGVDLTVNVAHVFAHCRAKSSIDRHNGIVSAMVQVFEFLGHLQVKAEPPRTHGYKEPRTRPDVEIRGQNFTVYLDVTVTDSSGASVLRKPGPDRTRVVQDHIRSREEDKRKHYAHLHKPGGSLYFFPIVFDVTGAFGKRTEDFFAFMKGRFKNQYGTDVSDLVEELRISMHRALFRGSQMMARSFVGRDSPPIRVHDEEEVDLTRPHHDQSRYVRSSVDGRMVRLEDIFSLASFDAVDRVEPAGISSQLESEVDMGIRSGDGQPRT